MRRRLHLALHLFISSPVAFHHSRAPDWPAWPCFSNCSGANEWEELDPPHPPHHPCHGVFLRVPPANGSLFLTNPCWVGPISLGRRQGVGVRKKVSNILPVRMRRRAGWFMPAMLLPLKVWRCLFSLD